MTDLNTLTRLSRHTMGTAATPEQKCRALVRLYLLSAADRLAAADEEQADWPALVEERAALRALADAGAWAEKAAELMLPRVQALAPPRALMGREDGLVERREQDLEARGYSS
jgi:hypothetical protein